MDVLSSVLAHRGRGPALQRSYAGGAECLGRNEPHLAIATSAGFLQALAPDILEECLLFLTIDVPEAEIVFIDGGHFKRVPSAVGGEPASARPRGLPCDRATVIQFLGTAQMIASAKILFFRANLKC